MDTPQVLHSPGSCLQCRRLREEPRNRQHFISRFPCPLNLSQLCSILSGMGPRVPEMQTPWELRPWSPVLPFSFPNTP